MSVAPLEGSIGGVGIGHKRAPGTFLNRGYSVMNDPDGVPSERDLQEKVGARQVTVASDAAKLKIATF